jgi:enamine deaminase RidA (YjgF/YER057c/UK114 family)
LPTPDARGKTLFAAPATCLSNLAEFPGFNRAYAEFFDGHFPARSTLGAPLLAGIRVEIDVVAELPCAAGNKRL